MLRLNKPRAFPKRALRFALLGLLAGNVLVRGIVPASLRVDSDFPSYFTAARIVADGGDTRRLYDVPWFQEQMRRYRIGKPSEGKFAPFPPPTALLLLPLTALQPLAALRVLTAVSTLCLIASIALLARTLGWSLLDAALLILLSGSAIVNALRLGQPYIAVSACCIAGYFAYLRSRPRLAGACWGIFAPLKYFPVIFILYFAGRRRWQVVLGGTLAIGAVALASIVILGWGIHEQFLVSVLGNHLIAKLAMQDPFSTSFQSFDTLFRQLFVFDATVNPHPLIAAPALQLAAVLITKAMIAVLTLASLVRLSRADDTLAIPVSMGLLGIVTLLVAPATSTYYMVLLWLPVGLLTESLLRVGASRHAGLLLGCYALIGFLPYGFTVPFAGRGALTVLAYPRLALLLAMFLVCLSGVRRIPAAAPAGELVLQHGAE